MHTPDESEFHDYGYDSDSDLEWEGEDDDSVAPSTPQSPTTDAPLTLPRPSSPSKPEPKCNTKIEEYLRRGRVIVLKDTAHKTWKALLYYLYTRRINFAPLRSEGAREADTEGPACSAKSMYRLADKLGLDDLKSRALQWIRSRLSEDNILREVFSSFTSMYPNVQTLEVEYLTSNFSETVSEGLDQMAKKICEGQNLTARKHCV
ncbi:hypothetical protein FB451DRAFT_1248323 [Mycena latifolia]|nr:hypothetical protein FB451DRAFT_1248323 [Mycena latifolia]